MGYAVSLEDAPTSFTYDVPDIPLLLTVLSLLYLSNVAETIFNSLLEAGLLGSLLVGIIYGPEGVNILPEYVFQALLVFGYIGLILLIFEAGLDTNISLLYENVFLSGLVALTGIMLPIVFSIAIMPLGFGGTLQGFAAGASMSCTSLGTTLSLINAEARQTRAGIVLLSAALYDDITGLIFAAIIQVFSSNTDVSVAAIARSSLVSIAFALVTGLLVWIGRRMPYRWKMFAYQGRAQLFLMTVVISGFVAGARYSGASELFGAFLSGVLVAQVFQQPLELPLELPYGIGAWEHESPNSVVPNGTAMYTPHRTFDVFIKPILRHVLLPIFFASIGAALPIRSLGSVGGSSRVVWWGLLYSLLMAIGKGLTGVWLLIPSEFFTFRRFTRRRNREQVVHSPHSEDPPMSPVSSALLLGTAMIPRGEIALIIAQFSRPIMSEELYAMVIWAILTNTVGGALGVGLLLRRQANRAGSSNN